MNMMDISILKEKLIINASNIKDTLKLLELLEKKYGIKIDVNILDVRCG